MFTDEQFERLEHEERTITEEAIATMFLALGVAKSDLEKEIRNFYQKYGKDGVVTYNEAKKWVNSENHSRRSFLLYMFIGDVLYDSFLELSEQLKSVLKEVIKKESDFFDVDVDVEKILKADWGIDESNWVDRLEDDVDLWTARLVNDRKTDFLHRTSIDDVLDEIDGRFTSMEKVLRKLVMSESTAIGSLARQQIFKELGVKKYRYYAREDERTCEECGALHGLVFPISAYEVGVTASPIHPHCRCWEVPIID